MCLAFDPRFSSWKIHSQQLLLDVRDSMTNEDPIKSTVYKNLKLENALEAKPVNHNILLRGLQCH